jgi:peptidyl-prolyl cis-trans isomerase A (cyclophilin A)
MADFQGFLRTAPVKPLFFGLLAALLLSGAPQDGLPRVVLTTPLGDITVEVDTRSAPVTAANFLRYVDAGHYNYGRFLRTVRLDNQPKDAVPIELVQAVARVDKAFPPIPLERTSVTGLHHVDGALSMARLKPDSATSHFFICLGNQPELDFGGRNPDGQGFAVFGRVISGLAIARRIQQSPAVGQALKPPIPITKARRLP